MKQLSEVEEIICRNQGDLFEYVARTYTYETTIRFIPSFLHSDFCKRQWDALYSHYQFHDEPENLDFLIPELSYCTSFEKAGRQDTIYMPDVAQWAGRLYRFMCIAAGLPSSRLSDLFPLSGMEAVYPGMHAIDDADAAERILGPIWAKT